MRVVFDKRYVLNSRWYHAAPTPKTEIVHHEYCITRLKPNTLEIERGRQGTVRIASQLKVRIDEGLYEFLAEVARKPQPLRPHVVSCHAKRVAATAEKNAFVSPRDLSPAPTSDEAQPVVLRSILPSRWRHLTTPIARSLILQG
jgi:hypothetical protein